MDKVVDGDALHIVTVVKKIDKENNDVEKIDKEYNETDGACQILISSSNEIDSVTVGLGDGEFEKMYRVVLLWMMVSGYFWLHCIIIIIVLTL